MALYHYQAELGLVPQEVWFVGYILAHRWTDALPYPSLRRMNRRTGVSTQMLHRYKQSLVEKGYLTTIARHRPSGGRTSNYYDFSALFHALEQLLTRDRRTAAWQPSADASLDGPDGDDATDFDPEDDHRLVAFAPAVAVPQSQRSAPVAQTTHAPAPDQPQLTGGSDARWTGAGDIRRTGPHRGAVSDPVHAGRPQEQTPFAQEPLRDPSKFGSASALPEGVTRPAARNEGKRRSRGDGETDHTSPARPHALASASSSPLPNSADVGSGGRWERACEALAAQVSPAVFSAWITPLCIVGESDEIAGEASSAGGEATGVRLLCPNAFHRRHVERRYLSLIEAAFGCRVTLCVSGDVP